MREPLIVIKFSTVINNHIISDYFEYLGFKRVFYCMDRKEFVDNKIENNIEIKDNKIDDQLKVGFDSEKIISESKELNIKGESKTSKSDTVNNEPADCLIKEAETASNKKNKISGIAYNIVRVIAFAVAGIAFGYASYELMDSYLDYTAAQEKYSAVDEMFNQIQDTEQTADTTQTGSSAEYQGTITKWVWDYDAMLKYNDESKGYIKLDGTRIQYPIVQHSDNDYYLVRGSDKVSNGGGAIFMDSRCGGLDARMSVVYGHNMMDGSMFHDLMKFSKEDFCKKNQTFDIYVGRRHYIYHIFSSFRTKADNEDIYKFGFKDDDEFAKWIKKTTDKSNFKYDSEMPSVSDKILICSTCVDNNGNRMVVCMYRGEEVVD